MKINYLQETEIDIPKLMSITEQIVESEFPIPLEMDYKKGKPFAKRIVNNISCLIIMKILSHANSDSVIDDMRIRDNARFLISNLGLNYTKLVAIKDKWRVKMTDKKVYLFPNWRDKEAYEILSELSELVVRYKELLLTVPAPSPTEQTNFDFDFIRLGERAKELLEKEGK